MFQFRAFPSYAYLIQRMILEYCSSVLPHSDISGSTLICSSPKLFAACHVLHRLLMPRHSPCALFSLTYLRVGLLTSSLELCRLNRRLHKIVFTQFRKIKVPQLKFLSLSCFHMTPLCCLAFSIFPLFSFQGAIEGIPSKLNNVRDSSKLEQEKV